MKRRLIWIAVAVAVIGGVGFLAYDRYLGSELRRGQELRDALAGELASAGIAFTSMEYDWRARRVVARDLVATKLPKDITAFTIGEVVYRGADPASIRAVFANKEASGKRRELITELTLSNVLIGFKGGVEFKQGSLSLKHLSLGKAVERDAGSSSGAAPADNLVLSAADMARRLHIRLLEAREARFWYPEAQATYEQALLRLEDYRAGNFSEFRLEGLNLVVAVVVRARLDEYFVQSVKARRFLDQIHRTPLYVTFMSFGDNIASAFTQLGDGKSDAPAAGDGSAGKDGATTIDFPSAAESAIISGNEAIIGFEALIPAVGRIAFEEISNTDRQFVNGIEVGGTSKVVALELQFNMLTQVLTAALDKVGVNLSVVAEEAGTQAETWLADHAGNPVDGDGAVTAALEGDTRDPAAEAGDKGAGGEQKPDEKDNGKPASPSGSGQAGTGAKPDNPAKGDVQIPMGPKDGQVEQGPAAPVPDVWGNKIKPPPATPKMDNRELAEIIRKLGFDNLRIDSEWVTAFDAQAKVWELSKYTFDLRKFWSLAADARVSGVGALEDLGHVPLGSNGWWQGPKADAVGNRFLEEGRFEGLFFTYRDQGFLSRLMALIAEKQETTVEALASKYVDDMFSAEDGRPMLQAEGLAEAIKAFLIAPDVFSIRFAPVEPVPFGVFPEMEEQKTPLPEIADKLGMVLTFNGESFESFKESAPISSDIEGEQD